MFIPTILYTKEDIDSREQTLKELAAKDPEIEIAKSVICENTLGENKQTKSSTEEEKNDEEN